MSALLHRCPQCNNVGKIQRSRARGFSEKVQKRLIPWYAIYRCHHCNWRGKLPRKGFTKTTARLMDLGVVFIILSMLFLFIYVFILSRPTPIR